MKIIPETTGETPESFDEGLVRYREDILRVALRLTGNTSDAQDLRQETIMRALKFRNKFTAGTNMRAWLRRIMTNTFINTYRDKKRERENPKKFSPALVAMMLHSQANVTMSDPVGQQERTIGDEVEHALRGLQTEYRAVLELVDIQGLSYAETAQTMSTPLGTVMSRLHRARKKLQEALGSYAKEIGLGKKAA